MISINIQTSASRSTLDRLSTLPSGIIASLVQDRPFWRDLKSRLLKLPEIKKGKYIGNLPKQTPHENAVKVAKANDDIDLYVGYLITRNDAGSPSPWALTEHSFCVKNGRVYEPTKIDNYEAVLTHYVGFKVPKQDMLRERYLNLFNRMSYIMDNSPMAGGSLL